MFDVFVNCKYMYRTSKDIAEHFKNESHFIPAEDIILETNFIIGGTYLLTGWIFHKNTIY